MKLTVTEQVKTNTGYPYAGGQEVAVDSAEVVHFGKLSTYGDFTIKFVLRLRDGREVFVNASKQEPNAEKWLRWNAKSLRAPTIMSRDEGWGVVWMSVS